MTSTDLDGRLLQTTSISQGPPQTTTQPFWDIFRAADTNTIYQGRLSDFFVYAAPLPAERIAQLQARTPPSLSCFLSIYV
jgi:hypothetical protein